jgi:enoyl-CoA hydratase/carnithine racemase
MIDFEKSGGVAVATLNRTPVNAINVEWMERFEAILTELEGDRETAVLRIRSEFKVFCAGFDIGLIKHHLESEGGSDAQIVDTRRLQEVYFLIENLTQVTIAEINGAAMGGGLELALSCDLRLAAEEAKMGLPEATLGQVPGAGGTQRLTRLCGRGVASGIILGVEVVDGAVAAEFGIVNKAVPLDKLDAEGARMAAHIAQYPAATLAASKACIHAQADPAINGFELEMTRNRALLDTPETAELVAAFFKR